MNLLRNITLYLLLPYILIIFFIIGFFEGRFEYLNMRSFMEFFNEDLLG